jgi:hypothetical protein
VLPVPWLNKTEGELCKHCEEGIGCRVFHTDIADECKKFKCFYNELDNMPIWSRPDKCKIIFERIKRDVILGTMYSKEAYKTEPMQGLLMALYNKGFSVILAVLDKDTPLVIYPSKNRTTHDVWKEFQRKLNERAILYNRS